MVEAVVAVKLGVAPTAQLKRCRLQSDEQKGESEVEVDPNFWSICFIPGL